MTTGQAMRMRTIPGTDIEVSVVGVGCNNFGRRLDPANTERVVHAALDAGITFFDTADLYGQGQSEEYLGAALRDRRDRAVIATKFGGEMGAPDRKGASRRWITQALEDSLRRLGTDHIDLYQLHFPDPETPLQETLETLDELVRAGKVRAIGSSNFSGWQVADADWISRSRGLSRFVTAQNHWSLLERDVEAEVVPACAHFDIGVIPYFPLANGLLTGKYRRGQPAPEGTRLAGDPGRSRAFLNDRNFDIVESLEAFAAERDLSLLDIAIGGLAAMPQVVSVIAGATRPEQAEANARAARWDPGPEDLAALDRITHAGD